MTIHNISSTDTTFRTPFENQLSATIRETMYATRSDNSLSVHAKHLLQELSLQASGFIPRRNWIKKVLQCGEHVARRVLKELRDANHLITRHYKDPDTGRLVGKTYVFLKSAITRKARNFARSIGQTDDLDVIDPHEMGFTSTQHFRDQYNLDAKWQRNLELRSEAGRWLTEEQLAAKRALEKRPPTETSVSDALNPIQSPWAAQTPAYRNQWRKKLALPGRKPLCLLIEDYLRAQSERHLGF